MPIVIGPANGRARYSTPGLGYREPLANGEKGTEQTIALMRRLVDEALNDSSFVRKAIEIVRGVPAFDDVGEVRALYEWVRRNIRYTKDPTTKEKLYPPQELLKIRAGDCDDLSMLMSAFAMALGYPARFVTIATLPENPSEFTHVYAEVEVPAGSQYWVSLDAARLDSQFGLEPQIYFRKRAWDVASDSYEDLAGNRRKKPKFLSGYVTLGQDDGINWGPIVQQSIAEIPAITAAVSGRGSASSPYGTVLSTSPYASYATPYTPGYGIPAAGYSATYPYTTTGTLTAGTSLSSTTLMLLAGAVLLFMMARK